MKKVNIIVCESSKDWFRFIGINENGNKVIDCGNCNLSRDKNVLFIDCYYGERCENYVKQDFDVEDEQLIKLDYDFAERYIMWYCNYETNFEVANVYEM